MDLTSLRQLAPHYLAMALLLVLVTSVLGIVAPWLDFWVFVAVAVLVGVLYPALVHWLGVAPEPWERGREQGQDVEREHEQQQPEQ